MAQYVNAMEWTGVAHNAAVRYVLAHLPEKPNRAAIDAAIADYTSSLGLRRERSRVKPVPAPHDMAVSLAGTAGGTGTAAEAYRDLFALFDGRSKISVLTSKIEKLERRVARGLAGRELLAFQATAAVARYSLQLWASGEGGSSTAKINWQLIVAADGYGYAVGGLVSAVSYSVGEYVRQTERGA